MTDIDKFSEPDNGLPSRRAVVRTLGTAVLASGALATACEATAAHPDATLLRLGAEFGRLYAAWLPIYSEMWRLNDQFEKEWAKNGLSIDDNFAEWAKLRTDMGVEAAAEANTAALDLIDAVATKIREMPAKTFAGLAIKARVLAYDAGIDRRDIPEEKLDGPEQAMNLFIAELERLASASA